MVPRKKGQKYEISYRCAGYEKPFYERFDTYEAAKLRIAQIEYEKSICSSNCNSSNNHVYIYNKRTIKQRHNIRKNYNKKLLCII